MVASTRAQRLHALVDLINQTTQTVLAEWEKEELAPPNPQSDNDSPHLPSWELYNAQRTIVAACGAFTELIYDPQIRLLEMGAGYFESRALFIAAEHRLATALAEADHNKGMHIDQLSAKVGIHPQKLARIMRMLTSAHVFAEVEDNCFSNNRISAGLVDNDPLRACIMSFGMETYTSSVKLPDVLRDTADRTTLSRLAFHEAYQTKQTYFEWLYEKVEQPDGSFGTRPSTEIFSQAMIGGGKALMTPMNYDYPWAKLGASTIVDVGGGVGSMSLELAKIYPELKFIVQDTPTTINQARAIWNAEHAQLLQSRVSLMEHDFFKTNPVRGAEIYVLRCVLHDWDDEHSIDILKATVQSMSETSRLLVVEQIMNTTVGSKDMASAPAPLLANYGPHTRLAHGVDLVTETLSHGMERTPQQYRQLATRAGLQMVRVWECRGPLGIMELRLRGAV